MFPGGQPRHRLAAQRLLFVLPQQHRLATEVSRLKIEKRIKSLLLPSIVL